MKNIIKLLLLMIAATSCKAQNTYSLSSFQPKHLRNNNYIKDTQNIYNNFAGTWQWTNGNSTFTIKLQKVEYWKMPNDNYYEDLIMGGYKYIDNGNLVVDKLIFTTSFPNPATAATAAGYTKMQGGVIYPNVNKAIMIVSDVIKGKSCMAELTLIPGSTPQIIWHLHDYENYRPASEGNKPLDFSIPTDVTLTKIP